MQPSMAANGQSASPGSNRGVVLHDYHDHSKVTMRDFILSKLRNGMPRSNKDSSDCHRRGVLVPFPTMLHLILSIEEENGNANILSW